MEDEQTFLDCVNAHAPLAPEVRQAPDRDHADAEDVMQDTLVRALEKRGELREPGRLRAWLLAIVRSCWLNSRRGLRNKLEVLCGRSVPGVDLAPRGDSWNGKSLTRTLTDDAAAGARDAARGVARDALAPRGRGPLVRGDCTGAELIPSGRSVPVWPGYARPPRPCSGRERPMACHETWLGDSSPPGTTVRPRRTRSPGPRHIFPGALPAAPPVPGSSCSGTR